MRKTKRTNRRKLNKRRRCTKQRHHKKVGGGKCFILTENNEIKDGLEFQCEALHKKMFNPKKHVDKISEISEVYTAHDTFLYEGKTGNKFPISPSKEILESMLDKNCYLLTGFANHASQPIIEIGEPHQCDALKQKIKNKDKTVFPNHDKPGKPQQILNISPEFTDHNIFTYISSTGSLKIISDNELALYHFSVQLHDVLSKLYKHKEVEEKKIKDQASKPIKCYLLLDYKPGHGFSEPNISEGHPHQCQALQKKIANNDQTEFPNNYTLPGNPPPQILEIHKHYTDVRIFTYISSTGKVHFISDDKDKLFDYSKGLWEYLKELKQKHTVNQCFLLKLNDKGKPEVLEGQPFQCKALQQKINNDDKEVFEGQKLSDKIHIYGFSDFFTLEHVFQYKSSKDIYHVISDNTTYFDPPNQFLINYLTRMS